MKKSRFTEEQIIGILNAHERGLGVQELIRQYGISKQTFYRPIPSFANGFDSWLPNGWISCPITPLRDRIFAY